jgi:integrase
VQQITKDDIERLVATLCKGGSAFGNWHAPEKLPKAARKTRDPLSPRTINAALIRVRGVFDDLVQQGVLIRNPAALVKSLPVTRPELSTLDAAQVATLLESTAADRFHIAWRLAIYGLRRGEILALNWNAVDFDNRVLAITAARIPVSGGSVTGATKTKSSERTLPMPDDLIAALKAERKRQRSAKLALGPKWKDNGLVVVDEFGNAPHPDTLTKAWTEALTDAGLPHIRLHDARHSCATMMHMRGVPAVVIAAWLGHTDARFTLATYAHSTNAALADAAATLGSITAAKPETAAGQ